MNTLTNLLKFVQLLNDFRRTKRVVLANGEDRWENDVEHSFQLAMLAWYIVSTERLSLNLDHVLKYALIHDLVEVYAGDTYLHTNNEELRNSKPHREREAAARLEKEFPKLKDLHRLIAAYEKREDQESKFIYALDKVQPTLNIYLDDGRTWKEKGITLEMEIQRKVDKVTASPEVKQLFDELVAVFKDQEEKLFG